MQYACTCTPYYEGKMFRGGAQFFPLRKVSSNSVILSLFIIYAHIYNIGYRMQLVYIQYIYETDHSPSTPAPILSPSLPLTTPEGHEEEFVFLLVECLRATIEGQRFFYSICLHYYKHYKYIQTRKCDSHIIVSVWALV